MSAPTIEQVRERIVVRGIVQGVGFRPFVVRLAGELALTGTVTNDSVSVSIEAEGRACDLDTLVRRLSSDAPPLAHVLSVSRTPLPLKRDDEFAIVASSSLDGTRTLVPPDVATCDDCLAELRDPANRRNGHPFITCTNCGPRMSIIESLPYDRAATTMREFAMCDACHHEYTDVADRRYHAQPIACFDCGPTLWFERARSRAHGPHDPDRRHAARTAVASASVALAIGEIVAVKGIGGFHLACRTDDEQAVQRLRTRKHRPAKPLAVMVRDAAVAARLVGDAPLVQEALQSPARPIVIAPMSDAAPIAPSVTCGLDEVGVLLPYTPVHELLFDGAPYDALVLTSGNLADEPLCFSNASARERLGAIADGFLMNDRPITVPVEDSVVRAVTRVAPLRRSRGYAPVPVLVPAGDRRVLGIGAEVKNTFCIAGDGLAVMSGHQGDLGSVQTQEAMRASMDQLLGVRAERPDTVVVDLHPSYRSVAVGEQVADESDADVRQVQHHHAHALSLLAEQQRLGERAVVLAFDGTGYGTDATIWGGELLVVDETGIDYVRAAHLRPFRLPGGDAAVQNPCRTAIAVLHEAGVDDVDSLPLADALRDGELAAVRSAVRSDRLSVETTSVGRLFDAAASILGLCHRSAFEAQAPMLLEQAARAGQPRTALPVDAELDFRPVVRRLVDGMRRGKSVADLAYGFHVDLAAIAVAAALRVAREHDSALVGLTGGVFQNQFFERLVIDGLGSGGIGSGGVGSDGVEVLVHERAPANDGGISLGQAVYGVLQGAGNEGEATCV